jgi:hypothetical protein
MALTISAGFVVDDAIAALIRSAMHSTCSGWMAMICVGLP